MRRASVTVGRTAAPAAETYGLLRPSILSKVSRSFCLRALPLRLGESSELFCPKFGARSRPLPVMPEPRLSRAVYQRGRSYRGTARLLYPERAFTFTSFDEAPDDVFLLKPERVLDIDG